MTSHQFREAIKAQPFRPFTVRMADGRSCPVPHPDFAMAPPNSRIATVYRPVDRVCEAVDLLLVVGLEFQTPAETGTPAA